MSMCAVGVSFIIWFSNISILGVPDICFSRDASCALNEISTLVLPLIQHFSIGFGTVPTVLHCINSMHR